MFKRFTDRIKQGFQQETLAERSKRIIPGAILSAFAAVVYLITSSVINVLVFRGLHLAVNWLALVLQCLEFGLILALAGAIVGWFTETYEGVVWGGVILALLVLLGNLLATLIGGRSASLLGQSIVITLIPVIAAGILIAGVIRLAIRRHVQIMQQASVKIRRVQYAQFIAIVLLVGLILGVFSLYGSTSLNSIRSMNITLQNYATDPLIANRFPYAKVPALKAHFGMDYSLYVHPSYLTTGSLEITIHFVDGYSVTCIVPLIDSSAQMLLDTCNEGTSISSP